MIYSAKMSLKLGRHIISNKLKRVKMFPFVLMLEPIFKCNLSCNGCGRIIEYKDVLNQALTVRQCLDAVREANAPVVSVTGGEPLIHPQIKEILHSIIQDDYFVMLCTNGLKLYDFLDEIKPHGNLSFVVHLDGLSQTHNAITKKKDTFEKAIASIKKAKSLGFQVKTNTTIYKETDAEEVKELFSLLNKIGTDGVMVSPAFSYVEVGDAMFLKREDTHKIFRKIYSDMDGIRLYNTPAYWDFLMGSKSLKCTPWANPTYNIKGWKSPCYLITDAHYDTFQEMMEKTPWENYGSEKDTRCANCMTHCGYEASTILDGKKSLSDISKLLKWNVLGRN